MNFLGVETFTPQRFGGKPGIFEKLPVQLNILVFKWFYYIEMCSICVWEDAEAFLAN